MNQKVPGKEEARLQALGMDEGRYRRGGAFRLHDPRFVLNVPMRQGLPDLAYERWSTLFVACLSGHNALECIKTSRLSLSL